jgi:hypothetical protein
MRQTISGLVAAIAVMITAPAYACGGWYGGGCAPCGYVSPCGATYERLPDPEVQYHSAPIAQPRYYYVDQGPTYTGPGNFAPPRVYREGGVYGVYHHRRHHYGYGWHRRFHHYATPYRYGYHHHQHVLHSYY